MARRRPSGLFAVYREAFGGLPSLTWLLCLAAFLNRCGAMVVPFLNPYTNSLFGYTPTEAAFVVSLYGVGAVAGSYAGGWLTDRIGAVQSQVTALLTTAAWMFLMTQIRQPGWFEAAVVVLAFANEAFRPGSVAAVAVSCAPELRRKAIALNRLMLNLGWAVGPTVGGYLVRVDFQLMFWVDGATCALAALFLLFGLGGFRPKPDVRPHDAPSGSPWRDGHFVWLMLANLIVITAFAQYYSNGPRIWQDDGYRQDAWGWFLAVNPIMIVLFEMVVVHALRGRRALPIIALGSLAVGVGYVTLLAPLGGAGIVVAMAIIAGGELLQMPLLSAYINDRAPPHTRGAYNGAYGMVFSMAQILAPLCGAWVYAGYGQHSLWVACLLLSSLAAWMFWRARRVEVA